jgi:hypothetical protein
MSDLTILTLCQALANITNNRCNLVENSNTCRCVDDAMSLSMIIRRFSFVFYFLFLEPTTIISPAPDIMLSEVFLIFFVLALWLSAVGFCLNQYKSLRRLETQVNYYGNRKDPLNIGDIKIVAREQDSIIYKKKRYSTALETHIDPNDLKAMQYVKEYFPRNVPTIPSSAVAALVVSRNDLTANIPLSITTTAIPLINPPGPSTLSPYFPLSTHDELAEEQHSSPGPSSSLVLSERGTNRPNGRLSFVHPTGNKN